MTGAPSQALVFGIDTELKPTVARTSGNVVRRQERARGGGFFRILIWAAVIAVFAVAIYLVAGRKAETRARPAFPVTITTGTATSGNIGVYLDGIGTVTAYYTASIFSQVSGVVTGVNYKEGQLVQKGDPLVDIDSRQYEATLLQAQGALERDENVLAQAKMDLQRYQDAWAKNAVAKQILDDQVKLVQQNEGTVKNDQGAVDYDQIQVDYCHIGAPFSGVTGLRLVDPGNLVQANSSSGNPLVVITQLQPITVIFTIPEDSLPQVQEELRKDHQLAVDIYDRSGQQKLDSGELQALDNQIDTTTGTLKLRAIFKNENYSLFPNQFVNVRLLVKTLTGVTLVPTADIQQNGDTSFVYVIQNGVAHERDIKPGVADSGVTQAEGVNPGDIVADSGFDKITDGAKVAIATGGPAGAAGGHSWQGGGSGAQPGASPHAHHSPHPSDQ